MSNDEGTILQRMLSKVSSIFSKLPGDFFYDVLRPMAIELSLAWKQLTAVAGKLDVDNLKGDELTRWVYQRTGIIRKPATKAKTTVRITGENGAVVKAGILVSSEAQSFTVLHEAVIANGEALVQVESIRVGSVANLPAGAIRYFPVTQAGLTSVSNPEALTNGYDAEGDDELRERYYTKLQTPATSGNVYHYLQWALEVIGVGGAKVFPLYYGDNTVRLVVIDANKLPASDDLVEEVQEYIDPGQAGLGEGQAPIGAYCTVESAKAGMINLTATLLLFEEADPLQVKLGISSAVQAYFRSLAFVAGAEVSYARIGALLLEVEGVRDYSGLKINNNTQNISLAVDEVPVLGEVTI